MKTLKFKHHFAEQILKGTKTSTWRFFDDKDLQTGDQLELMDSESGEIFAHAEIISSQEKKAKDFTIEELNSHGYKSLEDKLKSHREYYGNRVTADTMVKVIEFKLLK